MTLYLCMSMAGSIPVVLCLILWVIQRNSYNFYLGKKLLLLGMVFYLFPFQAIKFKLPEGMASVRNPSESVSIEGTFRNSVAVKSILSPGNSVWIPQWISIVLILWLCCVILFAVYQIVKYRIDIKKLLTQSERVAVYMDGEIVEVLVNKQIHAPYTVGFIRQSIIVPEEGVEHSCFSMFYKHEEQHKMGHDSLMKLICIIIICIHWINPIAILLLFLYNVTAEYICDARAVRDCTKEAKKEYAKLLIELSTASEPLSMVWGSHLSRTGKLIKRRINYIMNKGTAGRMKRRIAVVGTIVTVFASMSTILAYEPFVSTGIKATEVLDNNDNPSNFASFSSGFIIIEPDFRISDSIFVSEDGTQIASADRSVYVPCNHTMKGGDLNVHEKGNAGDCAVYVYYAKRCTKCGYIEVGDLHATITYTVCPH